MGRRTSKDPILFDGGATDLFECAANDPINSIDSNGFRAEICSRDQNGAACLVGSHCYIVIIPESVNSLGTGGTLKPLTLA